MRTVLYILIIILMLFAPVQRLDVAKLQPVEAVAIYSEQDMVILKTDTEDIGIGETALQALQNLKDTTPAVIYLDTAEYVLVAEGAESWAEELKPYFKSAIKVRPYKGGVVKEEVKYLDAHDRGADPDTGKN